MLWQKFCLSGQHLLSRICGVVYLGKRHTRTLCIYVSPEDALDGVDRGTVVPVEEDWISPSEGTGGSN